MIEEINEEESLPQKSTVDQLKKIKKTIDKEIGGDIGDKIPDMNKQGANIQYIQNPIETGIETMQDYEASNKNFDGKHILKRLRTFKDFMNSPHRGNKPTKKKKK